MATIKEQTEKDIMGDDYKSQIASNYRSSYPSEYKSGVTAEYKSGNDKGWIPDDVAWENSMGLLSRTALHAANYAQNRYKINKAAKLAKRRIVPEVHAAYRPVGTVRDLPPEVLAARESAIASIKPQYRGSDAVTTTIAHAMAEDSKSKERAKLGADRASNIFQQEKIIDEKRAQNALANVDAMNKRSAYGATEDARIRGIDAHKVEALRDLDTKALNQIVERQNAAASYGLTRELKQKEMLLQTIDRELNDLTYQLSGDLDPVTRGKLQSKYNKSLQARKDLVKELLPSYGEFTSMGLFKNGGKLVARH